MDYEELILIRQDYQEIYEDDPDRAECPIGYCWWDDLPDTEFIEVPNEYIFR